MSGSMMHSFQQLPRALKWAVVAAIGLVLFLVWDTYLREYADDLNTSADIIEDKVRQVQSIRQVNEQTHRIIEAVGPVEFPKPEAETSKAVAALIDSLSAKHKVQINGSLRPKGLLPKQTLANVLEGGQRLERLTGDLKFEASPNVAAAIVAELEASPDIETVNSVRISRTTPGKVQVQLAIEAWVLSSERSGGAA